VTVDQPRGQERLLLWLVWLLVALAATYLGLVGSASPFRLPAAFGVIVVTTLASHLILCRAAPQSDGLLLPVVACLSSLGLVMALRLAPALFWKQAVWQVGGTAVMCIIVIVPRDLRWLRRYRYSWLALGLGLLALSLVLGVNPLGRGARLWLGLGGLYFQPSEFLKLVLIVFLASYLAEKQELLRLSASHVGNIRLPSLPYLVPLLLAWGISLLLLAAQQDLGAGTLLFGTVLVMLYLASRQARYIYAGLVLMIAAGWVGYHLSPFVALRVNVWLDPWHMSESGGYQIVQSLLSFAAGGILGTGLGQGYASQYIPVVHTDFVFAAIGEELGLCGALAVLLLYCLLLYRGLWIAVRSASAFEGLLAAGLSIAVAFQAWVIAAGNLKLLPLTGVTLPFVSYGGSSLMAGYLAVGLLLHISARGGKAPPLPESDERESLLSLSKAWRGDVAQ
jgi:cell division protein FtsW (lipid II flippase)